MIIKMSDIFPYPRLYFSTRCLFIILYWNTLTTLPSPPYPDFQLASVLNPENFIYQIAVCVKLARLIGRSDTE